MRANRVLVAFFALALAGLLAGASGPSVRADDVLALKVPREALSDIARYLSDRARVPVRVPPEAAARQIGPLDLQGTLPKLLAIVARLAALDVRKEGDGYALVLRPDTPLDAADAAPPSIPAGVITRLKPYVALVVAYLPEERTFAQGTGFLVSNDGLVVTSAHVVKGASRIRVGFPDRVSCLAALAATDEDKDLAVLRVPGSFKSHLVVGDSDRVREGDPVAMMGYPMALELLYNGIPPYSSTARATVNAVRPARSLVTREPMPYIQIDAPVNPGNSGGPLFRLQSGEVVGVVQCKLAYNELQDSGVSFAIPINLARKVLAAARSNPVQPPPDTVAPSTAGAVLLDPLPSGATLPGPEGGDQPQVAPSVTRPFDLLPPPEAAPLTEPPASPGLVALHAPGGRMVADPVRSRVYAADIGGNSVVVLDAEGALLKRVFVGSKPHGLALSPDVRTLYVANSGGSEITLVDLETVAATGRIPLSFHPFDLALGPGGRLYATCSGNGRFALHVVDLRRRQESAMKGAALAGGALVAAGPERIFAAERSDAAVALYRGQGAGVLAATPIADASVLGSGLQDLVLSPDGRQLCVASLSLAHVSVLDAADLRPLGRLGAGGSPTSVALSPDGRTAYVCHRKEHVDCFDTRSFLRTGSIAVPGSPLRAVVSADGRRLFVQLPEGIAVRETASAGPPAAEN